MNASFETEVVIRSWEVVQYAVCGEGGEIVWGDERGSGKISMDLSPYVSIRFSG